MDDIRDSPWYYPVMFDLAVVGGAVAAVALDDRLPMLIRTAAPAAYVGANLLVGGLILRRRYRGRHLGR